MPSYYILQRAIAKKNFVVHFRVTGKMFTGPEPSLKATFKMGNFGIGVLKQFGTNFRVPNFFLQKSLHHTEQCNIVSKNPKQNNFLENQSILKRGDHRTVWDMQCILLLCNKMKGCF